MSAFALSVSLSKSLTLSILSLTFPGVFTIVLAVISAWLVTIDCFFCLICSLWREFWSLALSKSKSLTLSISLAKSLTLSILSLAYPGFFTIVLVLVLAVIFAKEFSKEAGEKVSNRVAAEAA